MGVFLNDSAAIAAHLASVHARRIVNMPITLARCLQITVGGTLDYPFADIDANVIRRQVRIETVENPSPEDDAASDPIFEYINALDLEGLARFYRKTEVDLTACATGERLCHAILGFVGHCVTHGTYGESAPKSPVQWLNQFESVAAADPGDHARAVLAAEAHMAVGWAYRGSGTIDTVSDDGWAALYHHAAEARRLIAPFDAVDCRSPGLASVRYAIARLDCEKREMSAAFRDWTTIDPLSFEAYQMHGFHLLPRWSGSHFEVELLARHAIRATADRIGNAMYAVVYCHIMRDEPGLSDIADPHTFASGVLDLIDHFPGSGTVNSCTATVAELLGTLAQEIPEPQTRRWIDVLADLLDTLTTEHLRTIVPSNWDNEHWPYWVIGRVFRDVLATGATVQFAEGKSPKVLHPT